MASAAATDNSPSSLIEQLSEELTVQQAVLLSLLWRPDRNSTETKGEVKAVRAKIASIKRQIEQARAKGDSHDFQPPSLHD